MILFPHIEGVISYSKELLKREVVVLVLELKSICPSVEVDRFAISVSTDCTWIN